MSHDLDQLPRLALLSSGSVRGDILYQILSVCHARVERFERLEDVAGASREEAFNISILEVEEHHAALDEELINSLGHVFILAGEGVSKEAFPYADKIITPPISVEEIRKLFGSSLLPAVDPDLGKPPISDKKVTLLASHLTAHLFQLLLHDTSFRHGQWDKTADLVRSKFLEVTEEFSGKL